MRALDTLPGDRARCTHCDDLIDGKAGFLAYGEGTHFCLKQECLYTGLVKLGAIARGIWFSPPRGGRPLVRLPGDKP